MWNHRCTNEKKTALYTLHFAGNQVVMTQDIADLEFMSRLFRITQKNINYSGYVQKEIEECMKIPKRPTEALMLVL